MIPARFFNSPPISKEVSLLADIDGVTLQVPIKVWSEIRRKKDREKLRKKSTLCSLCFFRCVERFYPAPEKLIDELELTVKMIPRIPLPRTRLLCGRTESPRMFGSTTSTNENTRLETISSALMLVQMKSTKGSISI